MKVLRLLPLLAGAALAGAAAPAPAAALPHGAPDAARAGERRTAPRQDPADSVYRAARAALGRGDYRQAEAQFRRVTATWPRSGYANDATYFQAYALYRIGTTDDLQRGRRVLAPLRDTARAVPVALRRDAMSLDTRICGELARRGDAECARVVRERADADVGTGIGTTIEGAVDAAVHGVARVAGSMEVREAAAQVAAVATDAAREGVRAAEQALRSPEIQRAIAEAGQEAARAGADAARTAADALRGVRMDFGGGPASSRTRNPNCRDADDDERVIALNALQQMDAERAMPLLRRVLARRDECSETLRRRAVFLVAQKKSPESADVLVGVARTDPVPEVREEAVHWLSRVGGDRAVDFLRDVARSDTSVAIRKRAAFALASSKEPRAREALRALAASRETHPEVRGDALYWAVARGDSTDAAWLRQLFPSLESRELKERAIEALARRRDGAPWLLQVARDAGQPIEVRKSAFSAVSRSATAPQLAELWDATRERELKEPLLVALSRRKEPEALDKLIAIARTEQDRELRKNAVYWLSRSSEPRALAFLQELIEK